MPFGSSISCSHFQAFSDAISFLLYTKTGKENVNYLDDFLFIALLHWYCNHQIEVYMKICAEIRFPVALQKTCWGTTLISFLGMLLDTERQIVSIPQDKVTKAKDQIMLLLNKKNRKATVTLQFCHNCTRESIYDAAICDPGRTAQSLEAPPSYQDVSGFFVGS